MLKRDITYTNFDDEQVTETYYFNLSKPELMEFKIDFEGGVSQIMEKMLKDKDEKGMLEWFRKFILMGYGERDGDRFIKSEEIGEKFTQTAAYAQLFAELMTDEYAFVDFLIGMLPKDLTSKLDRAELLKQVKGDAADKDQTT